MNNFFIKSSNSLGPTSDHGNVYKSTMGGNVSGQGNGKGNGQTTNQNTNTWEYKPDWQTGALTGAGVGGYALLGGIGGKHPVRAGVGAGLGALGGYLAWDYFSKNPEFQKSFNDLQGWAKKNLWQGAENHIQYAAPALGGLLGYLISK